MNTICIMCPIGCSLTVERVGEEIKVSGNTCKRGEIYGKTEFTSPMRTVTTLVKLQSGGVASCKSATPVLKERMKDVVDYIGTLVLPDDVKIGDRLSACVNGFGFDIVITGNPNAI